jgi:hypothetical protein
LAGGGDRFDGNGTSVKIHIVILKNHILGKGGPISKISKPNKFLKRWLQNCQK